MQSKNILLITPLSLQVVGFRAGLIKKLQSEGYNVSILTFDEEYKREIENRGILFYSVKDKNRSLNIFKIFSLKNRIYKVIKKIKPDVVFTFQLKPNIFGVLGAKKFGVKRIFSMVEGVGDVYINNGLYWKVIRTFTTSLLKKSMKYCEKVFFLNRDDVKKFTDLKIITESRCEIIYGIGVDLARYAFKPIQSERRFLMIARLLKNKGVYDYCKCARLVKQKYPDIQFDYLGGEGNVKVKDIKEYIDDKTINYYGWQEDVRPYIENSYALILPSYREGLPVSVMEAEATGRAIITTDTVGCRDVVIDGYNGFLCEVGNYKQIAEKVTYLIEHREETVKMGINSRKIAERLFDSERINQIVFDTIDKK